MRMIPSQVSPGTRSQAERKLFGFLQLLDLPDSWACLHSVDLPDHAYKICGELDFVIVGPRGLYVLEVKGGGVSCDDNGIWRFTNRGGEVARKSEGPFQQARSGMYALRERLLQELPQRELDSVVMGYGVVFPDCDFDMRSVEWPQDIILDSRRLRDRGIGDYLKRLASYWHDKLHGKPDRVELGTVKRIVERIRPSFEMVRSLQSRVDEVDGRLVSLTEEQYEKIDYIEEAPRLLIQGGAGTGKTFLAAEIARRHAAQGKSTLLVCFSPLLADFLSRQTQEYGVTVESVHGLMMRVTREYGTIPRGYVPGMSLTDPWFAQQLLPAFEESSGVVPGHELFDVLVVDEAQDILNIEYLSALGNILDGGLEEGTWRIFFDRFNQGAIFGALDETLLEMLSENATVTPRLRINCRNTQEIVTQTGLLTGADLGSRSTGTGLQVTFRYYENKEEAAALLHEHLEGLIAQGANERDITILSPRKYEHSSARLMAGSWKRRLVNLNDSTRTRFPFLHTTFSTVENFKGLENRFVALVDIEDLDSTPSARATVYVGMSRARVGLWVGMNGELRKRQGELGMKYLPAVTGEGTHDR